MSAAVLRAVYRLWVCGRSARPNFCYHRSCRESGKRLLNRKKKRNIRRHNESNTRRNVCWVLVPKEEYALRAFFLWEWPARAFTLLSQTSFWSVPVLTIASRSVKHVEKKKKILNASRQLRCSRLSVIWDSPHVSNASLPPHTIDEESTLTSGLRFSKNGKASNSCRVSFSR